MTACAFVIPGDIDLPTGGYAYDRRVLAALPARGLDVRHVALPGSFPAPSPGDLATTERVLAALPADTVLLIDGLAYGAFPPALVDRIRQPIVALCHHPLALETGTRPVRAVELQAMESAALARARHVVVTSPATRATLAASFGVPAEKITVAEPGTDRTGRAARWHGGPIAMLAAGSVIPRKGYDVLVEALAGLRRASDGIEWTVRVAGSKTLSPETTAEILSRIEANDLQDRITLLGAIPTADLDALYLQSHLFLMPSHYEGYGMVLAEAMARGLPIICTTGGAAADLVPDDAGLKVSPGDIAAFRYALQRIITQPHMLGPLSDASHAAGQRLPQWQDTARIIADVVKRVGAGGR